MSKVFNKDMFKLIKNFTKETIGYFKMIKKREENTVFIIEKQNHTPYPVSLLNSNERNDSVSIY